MATQENKMHFSMDAHIKTMSKKEELRMHSLGSYLYCAVKETIYLAVKTLDLE
jgi:hypothetical protein